MKVSIIIPVYNGSNYLEEAIISAINQDYSNLEVIVVNDGSTDNEMTSLIAKKYIGQIKYYEKSNGGVASALNFGIKQMTGDFFSWLSHDDVYERTKISKQINYILNNNINYKKSVLFSNYFLIDFKSNIINISDLQPYSGEKFKVWISCFSELNGCTLLIHKSIFESIGYFNELLKHTQDYNLWYKIALKNNFIFMEDHLVYSRQHDLQDSRAYSTQALIEVNNLKMFFIKNMPFIDLNKNKKKIIKSYYLQKHYKSILTILIRLLIHK